MRVNADQLQRPHVPVDRRRRISPKRRSQVLGPLALLINHAHKQVRFAPNYGTNLDFELHIRVENVQRCLAEDDAVLAAIFLNTCLVVADLQRVSAPLRVEHLGFIRFCQRDA